MQTVDVYNANIGTAAENLKNALAEHATAYFDSYTLETGGGVSTIKCNIGQTAAVSIVYKNEGYYFKLAFNSTQINTNSSSSAFVVSKLLILENAIVMILNLGGADDYTVPVILCKKQNGDTAFLFFAHTSGQYIYNASADTQVNGIVSVDRTSGAVNYGLYPVRCLSNSSGTVYGYSPADPADGDMLKSVYIVTDSDLRSHTSPFTFTHGGQVYTAIAGNYFAVKGT